MGKERSLAIEDITKPSESVRKILEGEYLAAQSLLKNNVGQQPHETVHEVRKSFKKIRAVLRLVRDATDTYHEKNHFFRDEARKISNLRDAQALLESLDLLENQYGDKLYKRAFKDFRGVLFDYRDELAEKALENEGRLKEIYERMQSECNALQNLAIQIDGFTPLGSGIKRTYKRGRKMLEKAAASKSPEDFHEWRKRVKYLRYQLLTLSLIWPNFLDTWEDELHDLSDYLGTDRDLFLLLNFMDDQENQEKKDDRYLVRTLAEGHRKQLQEHALLLGRKLYRLKSEHFVSLLKTAWDSKVQMVENGLMPPRILER